MTNKRSIDNGAMFSVVAEELASGHSVRVSVMGRSMRPFFSSGSTIELHPITDEAVFVGSVIFARVRDNHYAVHRIWAIDGDNVTMMGDGNPVGKEYITRQDIYGYVKCSARHLRWAKVWRALRPIRRYLLAIDRRIFK